MRTACRPASGALRKEAAIGPSDRPLTRPKPRCAGRKSSLPPGWCIEGGTTLALLLLAATGCGGQKSAPPEKEATKPVIQNPVTVNTDPGEATVRDKTDANQLLYRVK